MVEYYSWKEEDMIYKPIPEWRRPASGYGKKVPTDRMLKVGKKNHRVYCTIYSNIGTCYIIKDGKEMIVRDYPN